MIVLDKENYWENSIKEDMRKSSMRQWGTAVFILLVVISVMVLNFSAVSRDNALKAIRNELIMECDIYASGIAHELELTYSAANAVAGIMEDETQRTYEDIAWYARRLEQTQENIYMAIIADNEGKGCTSKGEPVDISKMDYFVVSRNANYLITEDDGVMHKRAYIMTVPYYDNDISAGTIYMFISAERMEGFVPEDAYDGEASFALVDIKGKLLAFAGEQTVFLKDGDLINNLKKADFLEKGKDSEDVLRRLGSMSRFTFDVAYNEEEKTFVSVPLGISDWQYITILNHDYVSRMVENEWGTARDVTIQLAVATLGFLVAVVIMILKSRTHYEERSQELVEKADTDQLTGLNNKIATERKISEYLRANPDKQCLFFLFDIDNFKKINDTLGHAFGDEVLRTLGKELSNQFRVTDIIGRTGGDEFIVLLKDIKSDEGLENEANRFLNFFRSFQAGEYVKYSASSSIGAAVFPRDAKDFHGLYMTADSALYEAKRRGKNQLVFYNKDLEIITPDKKKAKPIDSDMR